jgi:hypothetical protein
MQDDTSPAGDRERVQAELVHDFDTSSGDTHALDTHALDTVGSDGPAGDTPADDGTQEQITSPTKLIRIASMVRGMLDEMRRRRALDPGGIGPAGPSGYL